MYIGIDIGTSGVKSVLMDEKQNIIAETTASLNVSRPKQGYSEQNPKDWFAAVEQSLLDLKQEATEQIKQVRAISFSGQMHGLTLIDEAGEVLRPAILWNDVRCGAECEELKNKEPRFLSIGGNDVMAGFTAPKLEWVRKHEPEIFAKIHKILLPKDYIRYCLTGEFYSEMSDAAGTLWLDVARRDWSKELMAASQISRNYLPELVEGTEFSGYLLDELTQRWGMEEKVKVIGGAGDNAAAACGLGAVCSGDAFLSLGTSGVVFVTTDGFMPSPNEGAHAFCHAIPKTWHQMAVILAATDCVNWLSEVTKQDISSLMGNLGKLEDGPSDILFLPYISGERTPINDPNARGAFVNISRSHTSDDMARAVIEGVAFALNDGLRVLKNAGSQPQQLMVVGGGAKNKLWLEILATITGLEIHLPDAAHLGAAFGAARLAMAGDKSDMSLNEIFFKPHIKEVIRPNMGMHEQYQNQFNQFKKLYPLIQEIK
ncbi:MAG: xylulokinase [Alphaproteobacteria bacterium]